jgi:hypothetical protein
MNDGAVWYSNCFKKFTVPATQKFVQAAVLFAGQEFLFNIDASKSNGMLLGF